MTAIVHVHPTRRCSNCAHIDTGNRHQCLQLVSMADGKPMPEWFACDEHQTAGEYRLELHQPAGMALGLA